ncbi:MAG: hypothetical protein UT90_C0002G0033 [Parcubacteria group bacterium GW2011_GWA1_40_21]|nr:MAG: hypothetical protein UT90_C0002G0033 [Parcubacteria group bacterium GW2011_GWA1_40_21]
MITEQALRKARILAFWERYGLSATGKIESLNSKSQAPIIKRKRLWDVRIIEELKNLRP